MLEILKDFDFEYFLECAKHYNVATLKKRTATYRETVVR